MLLTILAILTTPIVPSAPPPQPPAPCASALHRAFDFWEGHWTVTPTGRDQPVATSRIDRLHGGCVIREQWMPLKGAGGSSLSAYDPRAARWRQRWVDSTGSTVDFDGGPVAGAMVLTGLWPGAAGPNQDALVRMTYSKNPDGSVRQHGEQSTDQGLTWATSFDFTYRPLPRD